MVVRARPRRNLLEGSSRSDFAYVRLREAIKAGRFDSGERVREEDVAEWLGVSRTPVRDALKRLESEGLLVAAPRRGLVVAGLDQQQVIEIYDVRDVLEGLAARLAALHSAPSELSAMRQLIERQALASDPASLARLNEALHDLIYRAARNRYLVNVLRAFERALDLLPGTTYAIPGRPSTALREHRDLVDAIERRDALEAERIAREHIRSAGQLRLLLLYGGGAEDERRPGPRRRDRSQTK